MKTVFKGYSNKKEREFKVLMGLIRLYLKEGRPIGSKTLMESEFKDLSSSTIRNYFSELEKSGYLHQAHASGGRVPTQKGFRFYAHQVIDSVELSSDHEKRLKEQTSSDSRKIAVFLQNSAELLSELSHHAVFLSAPRFDRDFIQDVRLVSIDPLRFVCVTISDFGVVQTELLHSSQRLSQHAVKRMEEYFLWRLRGLQKPTLSEQEEKLAKKHYNELMLRYIVGYTTFIDEEIYRTGFSKLLDFPDFEDPVVVASSLTLFENAQSMRLILKESLKKNELKVWIGDDLEPFASSSPNCSVIAIPYCINNQPVGAIGILGPMRTHYSEIFGLLKAFATQVSQLLTTSVYKHKITFRQPEQGGGVLLEKQQKLLENSPLLMLENQNKDSDD
ncbi:MAG: heat-inducible transcriptional repressor HrcA [Waddliaceae bacterium]